MTRGQYFKALYGRKLRWLKNCLYYDSRVVFTIVERLAAADFSYLTLFIISHTQAVYSLLNICSVKVNEWVEKKIEGR